MDEYFAKAIELVRGIKYDRYVGYVIWAFVNNKGNQPYFPLDISGSEWAEMTASAVRRERKK